MYYSMVLLHLPYISGKQCRASWVVAPGVDGRWERGLSFIHFALHQLPARIFKALAFIGFLHHILPGHSTSIMYTVLSEEDQNTRSGLRLVTAISAGKQSLWFKSTERFQSQAPLMLPCPTAPSSLSTPSHLIHWPCFTCEIAFAHLIACSCWRTSPTTNFRRWNGVALCQSGLLSPSPKTPLPCCTWPMMSWCLRADLACYTTATGVYALPVLRFGATYLSLDSSSIISSLTFEHLYSFTRLDTGSSSIPFP